MNPKTFFPCTATYLAGVLALWTSTITLFAAPAGADEVQVTMETALGSITLQLYPDKAPITVANFLRHVDAGKYDGATFYRVVRLDNQDASMIPIQVIQGGILGLEMRGASAEPPEGFPPIAHETTKESGLSHVDGAISMARQDPGTASSEFFISVGENPALDFGGMRNPDGQGFAVFGQVTSGLDIVRQIQSGPSDTPLPEEMRFVHGQFLEQPVEIHAVRRTAGPAPE